MNDQVSIRDYADARFTEVHNAVREANATLNERLRGMNEFRQAITDQSRTFVTKDEFQARYEAMEKRIAGLEKLVWAAVGAIALVEFVGRFIGPK